MYVQSEKTRILLVEDSEDDAFFFELALRKTAWLCDLVHVIDGGQAVDYIEASWKSATVPDLVFLDLKLPILTGFEVLEWLTTRNFQPRLRVVVLSGSNHHADVVRARELGALDYLVKPASPEKLVELLSAFAPGAQEEAAHVARETVAQ